MKDALVLEYSLQCQLCRSMRGSDTRLWIGDGSMLNKIEDLYCDGMYSIEARVLVKDLL